MPLRSLALASAAALAFAAPALADDWPRWLGPSEDGVSMERGWLKDWPPAGPPRLFDLEIGIGYSGVVVAEGRLILFHRRGKEERVESLDPASGRSQWTHSYPTDYADRYGYNGGPRCSPLIEPRAGRVYTLGAQGVLHALDLESGKPLWKREIEAEHKLEKNFFGVGAAPILWGGLLIVNLGGTDPGTGFTFAFKAADGGLAWKSPTGGGAYAAGRAAEIDGARQLFIFHRGGMACFDPLDGREKWNYPWISRIYESVNAATPLVIGDILFFSASYRTGGVALVVKRESYELLWRDDPAAREKILETHWSTAIHLEGHLYGFSGRHEGETQLTCVELRTGKILWRWESPLGRGSMVYSDGHFLALGERGDLALLKLSPEGHRELRRVPRVLHYPAWTPPSLANGLLYLRDEERLVCLDLRPGEARPPAEHPPKTGEK